MRCASQQLLRFGAIFCFIILAPLSARAEPVVAVVTKVTGHAQIGAANAAIGTNVHMNDRLRTGANARLQVTFNDQSSLTLGENANVAIDRFVFNPQKKLCRRRIGRNSRGIPLRWGQDRADEAQECRRQHPPRRARRARHPLLGWPHRR